MSAPRSAFLARARARLTVALALAALLAPLSACDPLQSSRVARGQLVSTGVGVYDDHFRKVHDEQRAGRGWADERQETRKPLVAALGLLPGAQAEVITAALRERMKSPSSSALGASVAAVARAELSRADRIEARGPGLEELASVGEDLRPRAKHDFPPDSAKRREVENELTASAHELRQLAIMARAHAREARRFVAELGAITNVSYAAPGASVAATPPKKAPRPAPAAPKGDPKPAEKPPETKPGGGEVFTP